MMIRRFLPSLALFVFLALLGAAQAKAETHQGLTFKIGVAAVNGKEEAVRQWGPLTDELEKAIPGVRFDIVPFGFDEIGALLKEGGLHYILVGPAHYVDLEIRQGVSRLATLVRTTPNGPLYSLGGTVVVRHGRKDINSPQDLKGRDVVGTDPLTIGGWLAVSHEFSKVGILRGDFKSIAFMPTYEEAVQAVLKGKADAAFVRTGTVEKLLEDGRIGPTELKVLRFASAPIGYPLEISTRSYPEWAFAKTLSAPDDLSKRVIIALLSLPPDSKLRRSAGVEGFSVPLDYGAVHDLMRAEKVGPYAISPQRSLAEILHGNGLWVGGVAALFLALAGTMVWVATMSRRMAASQVDLLKLQGDLESSVAQRTRELEAEVERRKAAEIERQAESHKVKDSLVKTVKAVALTVEMRDPYMAGHQQRVALLAKAIAEEMSLAPELVESIYLSGLVHDIGMIYVPSEITNRPGPLSELEYEIVKNHPRIGYDIMSTVDLPWPIAKIVLNHHRRLDGSGYPLDVEGEIPLEARILEVADVVEAMSSHRPYRPPLGLERAIEEIEAGRGVRFDPDAVDACLRILRAKGVSIWK